MRSQAGVLVLAKAPVPGVAKTRLAQGVGVQVAADLAAAALLDTLDACAEFAPPAARLIALAGDMRLAQRGAEISRQLQSWRVVSQSGATFAERLVRAHHDAALLWGGDVPVVQIGMDTPQLRACDLAALADAVADASSTCLDAALGPAADGGWWGLATRRAGYVDQLVDVLMSQPDTARQTLRALVAAGATVGEVHELTDVDTPDDAFVVAAQCSQTRFAQTLSQVGGVAMPATEAIPCRASSKASP
ncbi:MAG: DUF2064 domain-containing protein [Actinomycetota bacterium]|nr:DUF2064 domain-containing protein [Actinomycetota bacterium]